MAYMKKRRCGVYSVLLPLCLSLAPLCARPLLGTLILCISILGAVACMPLFRHRENLAVFLLVWLCGIPINLRMTAHLVRFLGLDSSAPGAILLGVFSMVTLFSIEEILLGLVARFCWKKQYGMSF